MSEPQRFIVEVWDDIPLESAFRMCAEVAKMGRISESAGKKHHCAVAVFNNGAQITVHPNSKSERFQIYKRRDQ